MTDKTPSYSGELKMVKVRRGKRGHKKSRSLVFRILRTSKTDDDSGIKISSSSEDENKELQETPTLPLQPKMPRLLFKEENQNESGISECGSPWDLMQQNKDGNREILSENSVVRHVSKCSFPEDLSLQNKDEDEMFLNTVSGTCSSIGTQKARKHSSPGSSTLQNRGEDHNVMNDDSGVLHGINTGNLSCNSPENSDLQNRDDQYVLSYGLNVQDSASTISRSTCSLPEDSVPRNKDKDQELLDIIDGNTDTVNADRSRPLTKFEEAKSYELRRSSRCSLLPIGKISPPGSQNLCLSFVSKTEVQPYSIEPCALGIADKKRRRKRNGPRAAECKKRKYGRPGRPPKSITQRNSAIENSGIDNTYRNAPATDYNTESVSEYAVCGSKNGVLRLPKNSVWTLVPKELFKSDFFKSQVIEVRHPNPVKRNKPAMPPSFPSFPIPHLPSQYCPVTNKRLELKFPKFMLNRPPSMRRQLPPDKRDKRPTVIYFKSERNHCDSLIPVRTPVQPEMNSALISTESTKIQNDISYLCNKYPILDSAIIKKCYDLTKGSVNETNCILSDLLSRNSSFILAGKSTEADSLNNLESVPVFDLVSNYSRDVVVSPPTETAVSFGNLSSVDSLCRNIIVESMRILYSEESVLQ